MTAELDSERVNSSLCEGEADSSFVEEKVVVPEREWEGTSLHDTESVGVSVMVRETDNAAEKETDRDAARLTDSL